MKRIALPVFLSLFLAFSAASQPTGEGHRMGQPPLRRALAALDLSDAQKTQIKDIFKAQRPAFQDLRERARNSRERLDQLASAPAPDTAAIGAAYLDFHKNREAIKLERSKLIQQIEQVLTPEQRGELKGMKKAFQARKDRWARHRNQ